MELKQQPRKPAGARHGGQFDHGNLESPTHIDPTRFPNPYEATEADDRVDWITVNGQRTPTIPMEASAAFLEIQGNSYVDKVREAVAWHPRASSGLLDQMIRRERSNTVREAIQSHPNFDRAKYEKHVELLMTESVIYSDTKGH